MSGHIFFLSRCTSFTVKEEISVKNNFLYFNIVRNSYNSVFTSANKKKQNFKPHKCKYCESRPKGKQLSIHKDLLNYSNCAESYNDSRYNILSRAGVLKLG